MASYLVSPLSYTTLSTYAAVTLAERSSGPVPFADRTSVVLYGFASSKLTLENIQLICAFNVFCAYIKIAHMYELSIPENILGNYYGTVHLACDYDKYSSSMISNVT